MFTPSFSRVVTAAAVATARKGSVVGSTGRSDTHSVSNPRDSTSVTMATKASGSGGPRPADTAKRTFTGGASSRRALLVVDQGGDGGRLALGRAGAAHPTPLQVVVDQAQ